MNAASVTKHLLVIWVKGICLFQLWPCLVSMSMDRNVIHQRSGHSAPKVMYIWMIWKYNLILLHAWDAISIEYQNIEMWAGGLCEWQTGLNRRMKHLLKLFDIYRLLDSLVTSSTGSEVQGSISSQGPRHTKDVIKMQCFPCLAVNIKRETLALSQNNIPSSRALWKIDSCQISLNIVKQTNKQNMMSFSIAGHVVL